MTGGIPISADLKPNQLDSAVALAGLVATNDPQCDDDALIAKYGAKRDQAVDQGKGRPDLATWDGNFKVRGAFQFYRWVEWSALQTGIDPGLLAANALVETESTAPYIGKDTVDNIVIGLDFWDSTQAAIKKAVPAAAGVHSKQLTNRPPNELGQDTGFAHEFANGPQALLAMAAYLKWTEQRIADHIGQAAWAALPDPTRFHLTRLAFNPPKEGWKPTAEKAARGESPVISQAISRWRPLPGGVHCSPRMPSG
jgi:hypothetical protein